jgi:Tfp pilus assembly protein FimV
MSTLTIDRPYRPSYRLTRRGRLVVVALSLLVVLAVGVFLAAGAVGTAQSGTPEPTETVMVGTGDTLWGIAAEAADGGDVRAMVERIKRLNALDSGMVTAGQRLRVPID